MNNRTDIRRIIALAFLLTASIAVQAGGTSAGEAIYRNGVLPSGRALVAEREGGVRIEGATAACINCHRRSGLGMREGRASIPPIAGRYLFHPRAQTADDLDLPYVEGMKPDRDPYTNATLARAIRQGVGADGKPLSYLMPRYAFDDKEMSALIAYLNKLSPGAVPGVTPTVLHFATIITPDADPVKRQGVVDVLQKFFAEKNRRTRADSPRLHSSRRMMFMVNRHWELHVWELTGAPDTWEGQLRARLAAEPVFAVISGLGGKTWAPVHRFCELESLPCLFPNVELPVVAERDFDNLYLSKGVLLEAQLIARQVAAGGETPLQRVLQVYRANDVGKDAAAALASELGNERMAISNRVLGAARSPGDVQAALRSIGDNTAVVLWLRADDISALGPLPEGVRVVFMSGRMSGLERAPLPAAWRSVTHMAYPVDLPERRRVRLDYPLGWFRIWQIPVVAQEEQADTYLACGIVSETINHMADTFVRDYLVERIEGMLEHRAITGYYPRLALAQGQRFASKGGYVVHFADEKGSRIVADGDWIAP